MRQCSSSEASGPPQTRARVTTRPRRQAAAGPPASHSTCRTPSPRQTAAKAGPGSRGTASAWNLIQARWRGRSHGDPTARTSEDWQARRKSKRGRQARPRPGRVHHWGRHPHSPSSPTLTSWSLARPAGLASTQRVCSAWPRAQKESRSSCRHRCSQGRGSWCPRSQRSSRQPTSRLLQQLWKRPTSRASGPPACGRAHPTVPPPHRTWPRGRPRRTPTHTSSSSAGGARPRTSKLVATCWTEGSLPRRRTTPCGRPSS